MLNLRRTFTIFNPYEAFVQAQQCGKLLNRQCLSNKIKAISKEIKPLQPTVHKNKLQDCQTFRNWWQFYANGQKPLSFVELQRRRTANERFLDRIKNENAANFLRIYTSDEKQNQISLYDKMYCDFVSCFECRKPSQRGAKKLKRRSRTDTQVIHLITPEKKLKVADSPYFPNNYINKEPTEPLSKNDESLEEPIKHPAGKRGVEYVPYTIPENRTKEDIEKINNLKKQSLEEKSKNSNLIQDNKRRSVKGKEKDSKLPAKRKANANSTEKSKEKRIPKIKAKHKSSKISNLGQENKPSSVKEKEKEDLKLSALKKLENARRKDSLDYMKKLLENSFRTIEKSISIEDNSKISEVVPSQSDISLSAFEKALILSDNEINSLLTGNYNKNPIEKPSSNMKNDYSAEKKQSIKGKSEISNNRRNTRKSHYLPVHKDKNVGPKGQLSKRHGVPTEKARAKPSVNMRKFYNTGKRLTFAEKIEISRLFNVIRPSSSPKRLQRDSLLSDKLEQKPRRKRGDSVNNLKDIETPEVTQKETDDKDETKSNLTTKLSNASITSVYFKFSKKQKTVEEPDPPLGAKASFDIPKTLSINGISKLLGDSDRLSKYHPIQFTEKKEIEDPIEKPAELKVEVENALESKAQSLMKLNIPTVSRLKSTTSSIFCIPDEQTDLDVNVEEFIAERYPPMDVRKHICKFFGSSYIDLKHRSVPKNWPVPFESTLVRRMRRARCKPHRERRVPDCCSVDSIQRKSCLQKEKKKPKIKAKPESECSKKCDCDMCNTMFKTEPDQPYMLEMRKRMEREELINYYRKKLVPQPIITPPKCSLLREQAEKLQKEQSLRKKLQLCYQMLRNCHNIVDSRMKLLQWNDRCL